MMKVINVVVPCYNEEESIPNFIAEMAKITIPDVQFVLIFVDDGSKDGTLQILREQSLRPQNGNINHVKYLSFSRNFGKEAALMAGLEVADSDYIAVMDADLQDPPNLLIDMYQAITEEGYDVAAARRSSRQGEPKVRSFFAKVFYKLYDKLSDMQVSDGARDFRLMTRQVVNAVLSLREYNRFSKGIFPWVGFSTKWIMYDYVDRSAGQTKYSFWKLFLYSLDGITAFSVKPLALASFMGILFCLFAFVGIAMIVARWLLYGDPVAGWPSTIIVILFVGGIQLFCTGIVGQYLAKSYLETKGRPLYILKEISNRTETDK